MIYERQPDPGDRLRLHLNENTAGCSPRVLDALQRLTTKDLACYPDYAAVSRECARFLGVEEERLLLVNGLDDGLLAASIACLQRDPLGAAGEAIIVEPAFGMYADCVGATGGVAVIVPPGPDLEFPLEAALAAITPRTRIVFLTSPGNPTGLLIPREALRAIASRLPAGAILFLDEAYADFTSEHFLDELPRWPNVVVGRTFSKSYGLAAIRIGAVIGAADLIARLRRSLPPYSVNVIAATVLAAALADQEHVAWYRGQVEQSRALLYDACDRWGLKYWRSHGNFVLVRVAAAHEPADSSADRGIDASASGQAASTAATDAATTTAAWIVQALADRGIVVRDRSTQPGCAGCIRITTGVVEHTRACLAALEEILSSPRGSESSHADRTH